MISQAALLKLCMQIIASRWIVPTHSENSLLAIGKKQDIANERYTSIFNKNFSNSRGEAHTIAMSPFPIVIKIKTNITF